LHSIVKKDDNNYSFLLKSVIRQNADVNAKGKRGETPLHYAARQPFNPKQDRIGAAGLLLRSGADRLLRTNLVLRSTVER
jgi:ankyrin repeat protein